MRQRYPDETPQTYVGACYDPHRPLRHTARLLQADLLRAVQHGALPRDTYRVRAHPRGWFEEQATMVIWTWFSWTPICNELSAMAMRYNQTPWGGWAHLRLAGGDHVRPPVCARYGAPLPRPFRDMDHRCWAKRDVEWTKAFHAQREQATGIRGDQWDWYLDMLAFEYSQWLQTLAAGRPVVRGICWQDHLCALHTSGQLHWQPAYLGEPACVQVRP